MFLIRRTHFMLRCALLLYFCEHTSCYVAHVCCTSVNTLHVTLHACVLIRWTRFLLRCARLFFNSVNTLHVTLFGEHRVNTLQLRCALLLHFCEHTSCYVARVCLNLVNTLRMRCTLLLYFGDHPSCYAARARFMLRCAHVFSFGERASCYAARF